MKSYILNNKQKKFLWDYLDMAEIYYGEKNNIYSRLKTCINKEWRLDEIDDKDYPYGFWVDIGYWDDISKDLAQKVFELRK